MSRGTLSPWPRSAARQREANARRSRGVVVRSSSEVVCGWPVGEPGAAEGLSVWSPDSPDGSLVARELTDPTRWELPEDRRGPLRTTAIDTHKGGLSWSFDPPRQSHVGAEGGPAGRMPATGAHICDGRGHGRRSGRARRHPGSHRGTGREARRSARRVLRCTPRHVPIGEDRQVRRRMRRVRSLQPAH